MKQSLIFVTNNPNKLKEVRPLVPENVELLSLADFDFNEEIPETRGTIEGNAAQKAETVHQQLQQSCFADDTGLEVEALEGAPGVYSARYAGEHASDKENIDLLLKNLAQATNRRARFKTVIVLILEGQSHTFTGITEGMILKERHGDEGFGYDPIFVPDGFDRTYAQMTLEEKNRISHRGKALQQMGTYLSSELSD